jgi:hypothetical protein
MPQYVQTNWPKVETFPTINVAAVSRVSAVAVVVAGLLVYFKKR